MGLFFLLKNKRSRGIGRTKEIRGLFHGKTKLLKQISLFALIP